MQGPAEITNLHVITQAGAESLCVATRTTASGIQPVLVRFYGDQSRHGGELVRNEFEITRKLCVPGVLKPIAMLDAEKPPVLVFDWLDLAPLRPTPIGHPWEASLVLHVARQLLVVAGRLHTQGILHLAINPFNLLAQHVPDEGRGPMVFLSGFGHAVPSGDFQRKPDYRRLPREFIPYLSPEQTGRTGFSPDERSDYYSIGAVLYELVSAKTPVPTGEVEETVYAILTKPPIDLQLVRSDISPALSAIIMRLLAKDPEDRYQSAGQILRDLHGGEGRTAAHQPVTPHGSCPHRTSPIGRSMGVQFVGRDRGRLPRDRCAGRTRAGWRREK
jgi:serine/threonine protein kinase